MTIIGDKRTFAFETSSSFVTGSANQFLKVDIFVADKLLTVVDNTVYVPQFLTSLESTTRFMRHDLSWLQYRDDLSGMNLTEAHLYLRKNEGWLKFLNWGPTTDDVSCHLIVYLNSLWITTFLYSENSDFETNPPVVHGARLSPFDLIATLDSQLDLMQQKIG